MSFEVAVSGLRCCEVLIADTDVSEEHAAPGFRVEVYRFRNRFAYTDKYEGGI